MATPPRTAHEFQQLLLMSELLSDKPETLPLELHPDGFPDALSYAKKLIEHQWLTTFPARLFLNGKWRNFFLANKYKVMEHIGSGAMGQVFLCEHRFMKRLVAIKILNLEMLRFDGLNRFRMEAQAIAQLDHPNIVRAYDLDSHDEVHFLVMEYIDGASLDAIVRHGGKLSVPRTVHLLTQAAEGLLHAHESGIIHRDVKPSNLMLDYNGKLKILDLGLARHLHQPETNSTGSSAHQDHRIIGTADYLAPEQARDSEVTESADIYSLGAVAHFLLAGAPPFAGGSVTQKLLRHQREAPVRLDVLRPDVPVKLAKVIARMLSKSTDLRQESMAEVLDDLSPWLQRLPPPYPEEFPPTRMSLHCKSDTKLRRSTTTSLSKITRAKIQAALHEDALPTSQ
ncbi:MAG: serine/threonine protein kinase [Gemmataceae bacterium]|nr:serine/threonine protein kinase [Gemmataceae bacterium]